MDSANRRRFQVALGITEMQTRQVAWYAKQAARANEHFSNGDQHNESKPGDSKSDNSKKWEAVVDRYANQILEIVSPAGYAVEFTGLKPCLLKDGVYIDIPD